MTINFGNVSSDFAKYRDRLPSILFEQLADKGISFKRLDVIDLGSGTGIFSRDLAKQGARVVGIEPSQSLIDVAREYDKHNQIEGLTYVQGHAEDFRLGGRYCAVTAVRAWHWFDRLRTIHNIKQHLKSNGLLIIINSIFLPDSEVAKTTFNVLRKHQIELKPAGSNAEVKGKRNGFPINWFDEWEDQSFKLLHEWQHDYDLPFTHEQWCGKIRSVSWITNVSETKRNQITADLQSEIRQYNEMLQVPHRFSVVVLKNM